MTTGISVTSGGGATDSTFEHDGAVVAKMGATGFTFGTNAVPVPQTVLSGPVDANGFAAFGGSTGSTTVTAAGTLIVTAANGLTNRVGTIVNPSWTGLTASAYLYLDIASDGTCTTGSTTLLPTYRWGGADVITANQFTFNIQEMTGKVGNGSTAAQTYRVFVGEVVASGTVSAINWYALRGRYRSAATSIPGNSTRTAFSSNLGVMTGVTVDLLVENVTTEGGYTTGMLVRPFMQGGTSGWGTHSAIESNLVLSTATNNAPLSIINTSGTNTNVTPANWRYRMEARRSW